MAVPFKIFRSFNDDSLKWAARSGFQLDRGSAPVLTGDPLVERIVMALGDRRAIKVKEVLESFETFARVRRRVRAPQMADLCCGHGLTGLIFAAIERSVEEVTLLDHKPPARSRLVLEAVLEAAPWVEPKVRWVEGRVEDAARHLAPGTSVIGVHACGTRTDRVLDAAIALKSHVAVMPCCYKRTAQRAPRALKESLGAELATDVDRTYWLEKRGWRVEWSAIPEAITPMNRILVARAPE